MVQWPQHKLITSLLIGQKHHFIIAESVYNTGNKSCKIIDEYTEMNYTNIEKNTTKGEAVACGWMIRVVFKSAQTQCITVYHQ